MISKLVLGFPNHKYLGNICSVLKASYDLDVIWSSSVGDTSSTVFYYEIFSGSVKEYKQI